MLLPAASRRVVATVTSNASSLPKRKFGHTRPTLLLRPLSLIFLILPLLLVVYLYLSTSLFSCNATSSNLPLIPALQRWQHQTFIHSNLRIYVYEIPTRFNADLVQKSIDQPGPIRDPRCDQNFYSAEVHIHRFLQNSPVRTTDPEQAHFFYVPIYTTCDLITHQPNDVPRVGRHFAEAMTIVREQWPYWNKSAGRDHVMMFAQGFAGRLAGDWQAYKNSIFMVHNGEFTAMEYSVRKDFTVPPELRAYLQPYWKENEDMALNADRKYLAQFGGQVLNTSISDHRGSNYSGGVRQFVQRHFTDHPDYRITGVRSDTYIDDMKNSKFCLAPEGWHPWSPRPYYAILMGCIPVIISEVQEMAFEEFVDWDSFAVWIKPSDIRFLDAVLRSFSDSDIKKRRNAMKAVWPAFWYAEDGLANQAILKALHTRKVHSRSERVFNTVQLHE